MVIVEYIVGGILALMGGVVVGIFWYMVVGVVRDWWNDR